MVIAFEGIDGSGKSTISKKLASDLKELFQNKVLWFSEPSPTELGKRLKSILVSKEINLDVFEQSLLFTSDRAFLIRNYIIPSSIQGNIIIMDRSFVSTYAYQIMNTDDEKLKRILIDLTEYSIRNFYIDTLIYLNCPPEISLSRIEEKDGIESKGIEFAKKVKSNYELFLSQGHKNIKNIFNINATEDFENVYKCVKQIIIQQTGYIV
ncbi:MAG: dTMP kinase [Brevinematales bacterium]|nr:dTMP kinase [Brevinematales bacterium]